MTNIEKKNSGLYSKSGVLLVNLKTGFPNYILSESGKAVSHFDFVSNWIDTPEGFKTYKVLNVLIFQEYFAQKTVEEKYHYLQKYLFEFHRAYKYYELHKQYINFIKKNKNMNRRAYITYLNYREVDKAGYTFYLEMAKKFTDSIENELAVYIAKTNELTNNIKLTFNKIFYERYLYKSVINLDANYLYNENKGVIINTVTKETIGVQFKTVTTTHPTYIEESMGNHILRAIKKIPQIGFLVYAYQDYIVTINLNQPNLKKLFEKEEHPKIERILASSEKIKLA